MALVTAAIDLTYTAVGGAILFCGVLVSFTLLVSKTNNSSATNGVGNSNETVNNTTVNSVGNSVVSTVGIGQSHPSTMCKEYNNCVYMDYNATTPVFVEVFAAMEPYLTTCFGNPSSAHAFARPCKQAVLSARKQVGELLCCRNSDKEIVFTSCGSESDNRAIDIALSYFNSRNSVEESKPRVITSAIEHPAVLCYLRQLVIKTLIELVVLPVDSEGFVDLEKLKQSLTVSTALVTIMHSNNEVGTIQPIKSIASAVRKFNSKNKSSVLIHSDGAQSLGKVLVDVTSLDVDMFTVVGHKFGAPKGIAALYINSKTLSDVVSLCPMLIGGGQEMGLRAGNFVSRPNGY